ncbi:ankyrin repeat domain-containing protein 26 isoform X3 [Macrotis lagotis]|uniref:ankyrin repeat domain-containing protein 26 isoform X3 n=1 Tax=Macrotis lagotis TaxID=92651 RepID=UPI003D692636
MKKIFGFGGRKGQAPSGAAASPRRDSGARPAGYVVRDKDLGKLHQAAWAGDVAKLQRLLLLKKRDLSEPDRESRTPLHLACANGYPDVVTLLVERKCQLNLYDNESRTPLIKAVQCQQEECTTILLEHGADPHLGDSNNNTALHYAASGQNIAIVAKLLKFKSEIEAKNKDGYTPLLIAIAEHNQDMVDFLLKNGANANAMDKNKRTALMIAVSGDPTGIVSLLLQYDVDLSCQDIYGWTAEEYAIVSGFPVHRHLINQCILQRELNQSSPRISSANKVYDTGFTLGGPAMDKEVVEHSFPEDSISRLSDKPGADDSWPSTDEDDLDFGTKKLPKSNLTKIINASLKIKKNIDEKSSIVNTEHRTCIEHSQSDNEKEDVIDSLSKPSSQGQCSPHPAQPLSGSFAKPFQETSAVLHVDKVESEEEEKEDVVLIDHGPRKQKPQESPNILNELQTHSASGNYASRKDMMSALGLEEGEETESPWDSESASESLPKGSPRHISSTTNQSIRDSISMGQLEDVLYIPSFMNGSRNFKMDKLMDTRSVGMPAGNMDYPERYPNLKPIQPTIEMKNSFTNQKVEKGVNEEYKSYLMEEFGLDDPDDIDAVSDWDSTTTSQKYECYRSSKDFNFNGNYPCKSLTTNHSGSTKFGTIPLKEDEAAETGVGSEPVPGFRAVSLIENSVPHNEPQLPLEKQEGKKDLTQELEFKGSSEESQESFDKSDQEQDKVTLETANIPEQITSKKQVKPLSFPLSHVKRMSQGPEANNESNSDNIHLDATPNWKERYEKIWVEEEKMEIKKNFKIITTELKQLFGEISEKDKIANHTTEKLQEEKVHDGLEEESKQLRGASLNLTSNLNDIEEKEKSGGLISLGVQPFPEQREYSMENGFLENLKLTFRENILQSSSNLYSRSSNLHHRNNNKLEIECPCNLNEEDIAFNGGNIKITDSKIAITKMKEDGTFGMQMAGSLNRNTRNLKPDLGHLLQKSGLQNHFDIRLTCSEMKSVTQEQKLKLSIATKFNEKTELKENLFLNSDPNANNSTNEVKHWRPSLPYSDKITKKHWDKDLQQDMQRFKNELGVLKIEFLALEKEKIQLQKEVEEEKIKNQCNEILTLEGNNGDTLTENHMIGKVNELVFVDSKQLGKEKENKIPEEEFPIMSASSSKESSATVCHLLKSNDCSINTKAVKSPQIYHWISENPGITSSFEKMHALTGTLFQSLDESSLNGRDHDEERPAKEKLNENNKDKVQMDADDLDDLTQSSDISTEDYDLTPSKHNIMLLIEKLNVDCKDSISLLKIQDAVLTYERSVELKKSRCTLLTGKVKSLEKKIIGLQEELSETREMKSQLERQKVEWERELCSLRFTLKQEEEKRLSAEMLFEKIRKQLRRKEEQYSKEMELKQQVELSLRTLDLELRTTKNILKQVEEERNDAQRQLSQEKSARASQERVLNNHLWKQKEREAAASKTSQSLEIPDNHENEKHLLHQNHTLQEEVAVLKLELEALKVKNQEKENQFAKENEILKEKKDELQKELKLNEEALRKITFQYSGQINVLTTENAMLNSKLENEIQNRDRLNTEIESYRSRLTSAIHDHEQSQTSKLDLEHTIQKERAQWLHLQDRLNFDLSSLRDNNGILSQELSKAESKINSLENELYQVRDSLREKTLSLESTQRELNQTQYKAKELQETIEMEKEKLNKYIVKQESIQERLAQIQSENMLLRQQLEDAQNKGIITEKVVSDAHVQFNDLFNKLRADNEKQVLMVEERNKDLLSECNHLREQICKYENEKAEREGTVRKLQQEIADSLKKQSMTEASLEVTSRYRNDLEDKKKQLQKEVDQFKSKLQESQEQHIQSQRSANELEDHIQKLEIENSRLEATVKQQESKIEKIQKTMLDSTSFDTEREELKKLIESKQCLENRLDQEMKRNGELQKDINGFKKLLKTTKKKLRLYERGDVYQGVLNQTHSQMDRQINWLKNKTEDLTLQLEAASSKCKQMESTNKSLQEELFYMKNLQKKCDKLEKNKRQLEEEVVNLKRHLEITKLEHSQVEQYKHEIEERARQEIVEKLKEVNLFLQTQAASQENLEQLRENNNVSIRNQMEHRIRDLESELSKMKNSHQDSTKAELERYKQLYSEELKIRKSLLSKLDRTNEWLAEVTAKLQDERQKNEKIQTLINSFTIGPVLEPPHLENLNTGIFLNRSLFPRGNLVYSTGNTMSENRMEAFFAKMLKELEKSITKELNEANAELESRSCRASPLGSTDESSSMPNLKQDPVSRATQEYLEILKKKYMI